MNTMIESLLLESDKLDILLRDMTEEVKKIKQMEIEMAALYKTKQEEIADEKNDKLLVLKRFPGPQNKNYLHQLLHGKAPGSREHWIWE